MKKLIALGIVAVILALWGGAAWLIVTVAGGSNKEAASGSRNKESEALLQSIDVDQLANQATRYEGRTVPVIVPTWEIVGDKLIYEHPEAKLVFDCKAADLARIKKHDAERDGRDHLLLTGRVQRQGGEIHLVDCRLDKIEDSATDAVTDMAAEYDRRAKAGEIKPAKGGD